MGNRSKIPRTKNPLLVSAKAITRACDPKNPSRITVLRLLGDALHNLQESQAVVDEIKARATSFTAREAAVQLPRGQLDADSRIRAAHEQGARALFTAVAMALIKLPSRGGPLRRRSVDLIAMAGKAAGPAVVLAAAEKVRDHILGLKRLTWSDNERGDFEMVCAMMTLAEISSCAIAGRDVAKDSVTFLLSHRVRQKCRRSDLARAIAVIVQSFPAHAPPDDRLVDQMMELCLSTTTLKQGTAGTGSALLVAVIVPHLVSRGPAPADEVTVGCGRALRSAPSAVERAMWSIAMVRASVTARRSTTYQLRKFGNTEAGTRFPSNGSSFNRLPQRLEKDPEDCNPRVWVSNDTFEEALLQVAKEAGLMEGRTDSVIAVASVLRIWSQALPASIPVIVQRTFLRLLPDLSHVSAVSALVDGIWLGLLKDLRPSMSSAVFDNLLPSLFEQRDLPFAAALHVCSTLLVKYGRQCIRESGLTVDYNSVTTTLIKRAHEALEVASNVVRMGGVQLMTGLLSALPRTCSQLLTAVLQNLRIADLTLATKERSIMDLRTFSSVAAIEQELSSILGHSAALSVIIGTIASGQCSVPAALVRQCGVDGLALLRPHQVGPIEDIHGAIAGGIRRRAGWGVVAALACAKHKNLFEGESLTELLTMWKEELGYAGQRESRNSVLNTTFAPPAVRRGVGQTDAASAPTFDELLALSSTRSAALKALYCALKHANSEQLSLCARSLMGACAARIVATQSGLGTSISLSYLFTQGMFDGGGILDLSGDKKKNSLKLSKLLTIEAAHVTQCLSLVPPHGDPAELCYYVALGLGEEAQRVLGEVEVETGTDPIIMNSASSASDRSAHLDSAMTNHRLSLNRFLPADIAQHGGVMKKQLDFCKSSVAYKVSSRKDGYFPWMFSMHGVGALDAEEALIYSAAGVAGIVTEDLTKSGSLVESLASAKLSPCLSAAIALSISQRLSRSDLAEINRALAVLQVLAKRALGVTGGIHRTILYESKNGKLYDPNPAGDSYSFREDALPGLRLERMGGSDGWPERPRNFSEEGLLGKMPFHDFHTRGLGIMYATRSLAAATHRELGTTGGPLLWKGLMRRVIMVVKENSGSLSSSQSILLSSSIAALGALLEVVPEPAKSLQRDNEKGPKGSSVDWSVEIDDITDEAVAVLADTLEKGNAAAQTAAALALSNCSNRVASVSERLLGALLRAWAQDNGEFSSLGHIGRCTDEATIWTRCFLHIWKDMGIRAVNNVTRFFSQDSCGIGGCSPSLAAGATAVLSSCRLHWREVTESCYCSVTELSTELLQWSGISSRNARAAGLYGMTALWAARIDTVRAQRVSEMNGSFSSLDSFSAKWGGTASATPLLPVQTFSLKEPTKLDSAAGPFLDEILYEALAPQDTRSNLDELHGAATTAITEMIRGAGSREICRNLPRLPECLFATVESGSLDAEKLLDVLVRLDARIRPRYWFGLCRAVCLDEERLNFGVEKSTWDVSYRSKSVAIRIATEAIDCSVASCKCAGSTARTAPEKFVKHTCAYGFLGKAVEFVEEISGAKSFDLVCCGEGCKLIQRLSSRIGSSASQWSETDQTLRDFRDIWDSCFAMMEALLVDKVPHTVVNNAGLAISDLLVSFLRLSETSYFQSAHGKVSKLLDRSVGPDLRARFLYDDQGEEVGIRATLALVARYAKVMTALRATTQSRESGISGIVSLRSTRTLFFAILGDFVSTFSPEGLAEAAQYGGALTAGLIDKADLQNALSEYIAPIILGAVSCVGIFPDADGVKVEGTWANAYSAGVKIAEGGGEHDEIAVGALVWLLKHEYGGTMSLVRKPFFNSQCQEAVINLCLSNATDLETIREVLVSLAQWSKEEYLMFTHRISTVNGLLAKTFDVLIPLGLTILRDVANDELSPSVEEKSRVVCTGLRGISNLLSRIVKGNEKREASYAHALDTVFQIMDIENEAAKDLFDDFNFQRDLCVLLEETLQEARKKDEAYKLALSKVRVSFEHGIKNGSLPHVRVNVALLALLSGTGDVKAKRAFSKALLMEVSGRTDIGTDSGSDTGSESTSNSLPDSVLRVTLKCYGVEQGIIGVLCSGASAERDADRNVLAALAYRIGQLGMLSEADHVLPALRISMAALGTKDDTGGVVRGIGLVMYSTFLPKLIQLLPTSYDQEPRTESAAEVVKFFMDVAEQDSETLSKIVVMLPQKQRDNINLLLKSVESEEPPI